MKTKHWRFFSMQFCLTPTLPSWPEMYNFLSRPSAKFQRLSHDNFIQTDKCSFICSNRYIIPFFYPYLNYGLASWGAAYKTRLNKICTKQNRCIRSIFFAHGREHVNPYFNLLGILKLENIFTDYSIFSHLHQRFTIPGMLRIKKFLSYQQALIMVCLH